MVHYVRGMPKWVDDGSHLPPHRRDALYILRNYNIFNGALPDGYDDLVIKVILWAIVLVPLTHVRDLR